MLRLTDAQRAVLTQALTGVLVLFGGILLCAIIIAILDGIAWRKERQSEHHPPA